MTGAHGRPLDSGEHLRAHVRRAAVLVIVAVLVAALFGLAREVRIARSGAAATNVRLTDALTLLQQTQRDNGSLSAQVAEQSRQIAALRTALVNAGLNPDSFAPAPDPAPSGTASPGATSSSPVTPAPSPRATARSGGQATTGAVAPRPAATRATTAPRATVTVTQTPAPAPARPSARTSSAPAAPASKPAPTSAGCVLSLPLIGCVA